ncbi:sterol desaturase family protein [Pseudenhygromyxa sp. WMMC2535]|uniref:sterol desaturase family protein n=1 Tax=Pseudenhygromyxa sp. WMMC2535 TaxID=2712867 RepID=UPI0015568B1D|nr:sterol desaturase family protein [Pseudenhygromyxa sp. WMMC2535]NVB37902.1 sterol desaturase family protein [Pseudenhygromyxa sp. WMMC2535]
MATPSSPTIRHVAEGFDKLLPFLLTAAGLLHPSPSTWYACLAVAFVAIAGPLLAGAGVATWFAERSTRRIQGPRTKPAAILDAALESARACWVAACMAAWPLAQWRLGQPTGMILDLDAAGLSVGMVVLQTILGVFVVDAWLYWKHRLLHTRALFVFHKKHHAFRDPTPFAGFAVGPVESLLTFWPILLLCIPAATHWAPLYFALVVGFICLNFYLHCGVALRALEAVVPKTGLNTSAFHNIHHSHAVVNFGEAMTLWDRLCKTRLEDQAKSAEV